MDLKKSSTIILGILLISLAQASDYGFCNPSLVGGDICSRIEQNPEIIAGANYSINTNNSNFLNGYPYSSFYPFSNSTSFLTSFTEADTLQSVTARGENTTIRVNFLNITTIWDDFYVKPKTNTVYYDACEGEPSNSDCSQFESQENCEAYSSWGGECSWSAGESCDIYDGDEGSCGSNSPPCTANYGDYCDEWDGQDISTCTGNGMYSCNMDYDYGDCYGSSYFSGCSGTLSEAGCSGTLTCANQVASEEQCEAVNGCSFEDNGGSYDEVIDSNLYVTKGNATINGTTRTNAVYINDLTNYNPDYTYWNQGKMYNNGSLCLNAPSPSYCTDTNWQVQIFGGNNAYGYIGAMKSRSTTRTQFQVATSDGNRGFVIQHYDGQGRLQIYSGSTAEQNLSLIGSTGADTVTLILKNLYASGFARIAGALTVIGASNLGSPVTVGGGVGTIYSGSIGGTGGVGFNIFSNARTRISLPSTTNGTIYFNPLGDNVNHTFYSYNNATPSLFIDGSTKKVGIGTSSPAQTLDVNGSVAISNNLSIGGTMGLTGSYNCTSYPNVTIKSGIITGWVC